MDIRAGDYGYDINFTVYQSDGETPQVLTGYTVKLQIAHADTYRNELNADCTIVDANAGTCKYTVQLGDFDSPGNFIGAIVLTDGSTRLSTKDISITVKKKLAS